MKGKKEWAKLAQGEKKHKSGLVPFVSVIRAGQEIQSVTWEDNVIADQTLVDCIATNANMVILHFLLATVGSILIFHGKIEANILT